MELDPFVTEHASSAPGSHVKTARTSRTGVRKKIERIRAVLQQVFDDEGLDLKASDIIRSEETSTRSVRYRLYAKVTWVHWPLPQGEDVASSLPTAEIPGSILNPPRVIPFHAGM
jgi:hypothetical protein